MIRGRILLCLLLGLAGAAAALPGRGPVVDWDRSHLRDTWRGGLLLEFALSDPAPFALGMASGPDRLEVRLGHGLEGRGTPQSADRARRAGAPRLDGAVLQVPLGRPMVLAEASMDRTGDRAMLRILLVPADRDTFARAVRRWADRPPPAVAPVATPPADGPLRVMIDPGHGGIDPGAEHGGYREADLVLAFARTLADALRARGAEPLLTREADRFVPLPERVARANRAGADVFVSLHADALRAGTATGASVHVLPEGAATAADRFLLERLGFDALAGAVPRDDTATRALMGLSRQQTAALSQRLAETLLDAMRAEAIALYKTPLKRSNFVVLRAADMPSVLVELGFLSEAADRARLIDPAWRARMAAAVADGLTAWAALR